MVVRGFGWVKGVNPCTFPGIGGKDRRSGRLLSSSFRHAAQKYYYRNIIESGTADPRRRHDRPDADLSASSSPLS